MHSQKGFSLVELLAALVILTIVITTSLAVFTTRRDRLNQASEMILAYQVLANEAELERRIPYSQLAPSTTFASSTALLRPLGTYTTKIDVATPTNGPTFGVKDVTMSITWRGGKRSAQLVLKRVDTGGGNLW